MLPDQELKNAVSSILKENQRRLDAIRLPFNPISGLGSVGERVKVVIRGFPIRVQWIPVGMMSVPLVRKLAEFGDLDRFISETIADDYTDEDRLKVIDAFVRVRSRHDFPFWAATFVTIQSKEPGEGEIPFRLSRPQRKFVAKLEEMRLAGRPIRLVLLKARQWGGSTCSQIYMCWLQLVHKVSLNSAIVAQTKKTSFAIKAMYDRALKYYPLDMMYPQGAAFSDKEPKMVNVGMTGDYKRIPQRDCTITVASYEVPDALRGDAYSLVHCSEVGLWSPTDRKSPESVVRSVCSGVLLRPYTMIIYESTANGTGNFFQEEYDSAKAGVSQFDALFISWYDIDLYSAPIPDDEIEAFAEWLYVNRLSANVYSRREEPGRYLWWLWQQGATLQGIKWYISERKKMNSHEVMAAEYPTDDVEAFVHSGAKVFDKYRVEALKKTCKPPKYIGDVYADRDSGKEAFRNVRFVEDGQGDLWVWALPEIDPDEIVTDRYLVVVDIGGRSHKADWSVIAVFDRLFMQEGGKPVVVAQWYGHIDIDLLAWKAGQIAAFYDNALLVIESNTLETHDKERQVDGDQSQFVLNQLGGVYSNLYARSSPEDSIVEGAPVKYGFHTNISTKPMVISTLVKVVREASYIERDERCLHEFLNYEKRQNGSFGAVKGKHDDLLMTRAIGLHICFFEMELPKILPRKKKKSLHRRPVSAASI